MLEKYSKRTKDTLEVLDSAAIISIADSKGKITYVNKKFEDISGYTLDEVIGKDHSIVNSGTHPREFWTDMYKAIIVNKTIWNKICTNRRKDGELYHVDTSIKALFDDDGKLEGFMSIRQDVTELKKKEVEISNRMNAINRSNAVIEFDLDGKIRFANEAFLKIIGYTSEEIFGKHHSMFVEEDVKNTQEYVDFWENLRRGIFFNGEIIRVKKDGSLLYLQATYNPVIGTDGKPYRIMKIAVDITTSVLQKKEIEKKNTYLEHAAKILRHDMHSGINTYIPRGITSLERRLDDETVLRLKLEAPMKMLKEGLKHTQKVYKGVYEFTNLVKKDVVLTKPECSLKTILTEYLITTAYRHQVVIEDLGIANVNEPLFCTAIDNLIRNGLKYNDSNTKLIKIYKESDLLIVEDNGRGLTKEDFLHLSQPYVRKASQAENGSGLGLSICIAILEEHHFDVDCEKRPEGGTRLKIRMA